MVAQMGEDEEEEQCIQVSASSFIFLIPSKGTTGVWRTKPQELWLQRSGRQMAKC